MNSLSKYKLIVDNANVAIIVVQNGLIKFYNDKAVNIIGSPDGKLPPKSFIEYVHPLDRELVSGRYKKRLQGLDVPDKYSLRILNSEGGLLWVSVNVVKIEWDDEPAILIFLSNITRQKLIEEAFIESERRYFALFESIPEAVILFDENVEIIDCNSSVERLTGHNRNYMIGKSLEEVAFFDKYDTTEIYKMIHDTFQEITVSPK